MEFLCQALKFTGCVTFSKSFGFPESLLRIFKRATVMAVLPISECFYESNEFTYRKMPWGSNSAILTLDIIIPGFYFIYSVPNFRTSSEGMTACTVLTKERGIH